MVNVRGFKLITDSTYKWNEVTKAKQYYTLLEYQLGGAAPRRRAASGELRAQPGPSALINLNE